MSTMISSTSTKSQLKPSVSGLFSSLLVFSAFCSSTQSSAFLRPGANGHSTSLLFSQVLLNLFSSSSNNLQFIMSSSNSSSLLPRLESYSELYSTLYATSFSCQVEELQSQGRQQDYCRLLFPLTFIVGVVLLGTLIGGLSVSFIFSCQSESFTYQWYLISALNLILAIIMIIFSSEMKRQLRESAEKIHIDQHDTKLLKMRLRQLSTLQLWILLLSIVRLAWFILAHLTLVKKQIACFENNYFESITEGGSVFLLVKSLIIDLGPQFLFWIIFFQIPYSFKFLVTEHANASQFDLRSNSRHFTLAQKKQLINSLIENDNREYERISKLAQANRLPLVENESPERQEANKLRLNDSFVDSRDQTKDNLISSQIHGINATDEGTSGDNGTLLAFQFSDTLLKEAAQVDLLTSDNFSREGTPNENAMRSLVTDAGRPQSPNSFSKHKIGKKKSGAVKIRKGSLYDSQ